MSIDLKDKILKGSARLEIDCLTLARLLANRQIRLCELRCLDPASKQVLQRLCLDTCLQACQCRKTCH